MSEFGSPEPVGAEEQRIIDVDATITGREVADYYQELADEIDLKEKDLQIELEVDPSLVSDDGIYERWVTIKAEKALLERIGGDLAKRTLETKVDNFLRQMFGEISPEEE